MPSLYRAEIKRLHQCFAGGKTHNGGVSAVSQSSEDARVAVEVHSKQCLLQVPRSQLGCSACGADSLDERCVFHDADLREIFWALFLRKSISFNAAGNNDLFLLYTT